MVKNNHMPAGGNSNAGDGRLKEEGLTPTTSTSTPHRIFSVDDDPKEIQSDIRYLEGLHEGLKFALHANKSKRSVSSQSPMIHSSNNTLHHHEHQHQQHLPPTLELLSSKAHSVPDLNTVTSASPRRLHSPIRELSHDGIDDINDDNDDSRFIIHDSHGHDLLIDEVNCQSPSHLESNDPRRRAPRRWSRSRCEKDRTPLTRLTRSVSGSGSLLCTRSTGPCKGLLRRTSTRHS